MKEKSKSVDDFVGTTPLNNLNTRSNQDLLHSSKNLKAQNKSRKMKSNELMIAASSNFLE